MGTGEYQRYDGIILPFVSISTFTKQIDSTLRLCFQSTLSYNAHALFYTD
jgi:hypothetical protein